MSAFPQSTSTTIGGRLLICLLGAWVIGIADGRRLDADDDQPPALEVRNETLRGRVVYLAEAMQRRFGIKSVRESLKRTLAIETVDGELVPLVEDIRGRAFRADPRLLALKDVELLVRRHPQAPAVQIVRLYTYQDGKRMELDYWCEICAIALFELKPCDCCQGDIELRLRHMPAK